MKQLLYFRDYSRRNWSSEINKTHAWPDGDHKIRGKLKKGQWVQSGLREVETGAPRWRLEGPEGGWESPGEAVPDGRQGVNQGELTRLLKWIIEARPGAELGEMVREET